MTDAKRLSEVMQMKGRKSLSEKFRDSEVQAESIEDFLDRYYRPDRFRGRGEEYAEGLIQSHRESFDKRGYDIISRHDSVTGQVVAYFGPTERVQKYSLEEAREVIEQRAAGKRGKN